MDIVWQAEDSLREKKVESDLKDLLKTMVAFANSVAPDDTAKIFIGEKDDGIVQGVTDPDSIQKRVVKEAEKIYPEIYYRTEVYERAGKRCVRVGIRRNGLAPHFAGAAWVRKGSQTVPATEGPIWRATLSRFALLSTRLSYEDRANVPEKRECGVSRTPIGTYGADSLLFGLPSTSYSFLLRCSLHF